MNASVIRAQLGLLIRLMDTTTGAAVEERNVQFFSDGQRVHPAPRGNGCFVFINIERVNFRLSVRVSGFEKHDLDVRYEELDDRIPTCDIFLIPSEKNAKGDTVTSIFGNLPFLESIEAVDLGSVVCRLSDYNEKKLTMSVIKPAGKLLELDYMHYALLKADRKSYEKIVVSGINPEQKIILKDALQTPYTVNSPICRVIFGKVDNKGNYLLRVRNDAEEKKFLVRYTVKGTVYFQQMDLGNPENTKLDIEKSIKEEQLIKASEE
jgi:hypothetical protein